LLEAIGLTVGGSSSPPLLSVLLFPIGCSAHAVCPNRSSGRAASTATSGFNVYRCWDIYLMGLIFTFMIGSNQVSIMSFAPWRWRIDGIWISAIGNVSASHSNDCP
jgi:hypothetical protein